MKRFFSLLYPLSVCRTSRTALLATLLAASGFGGAAFAQPAPAADDRPETVITSDELDMVGGEDANHFFFRRNVKIQATNMIATCDEMEVISARQNTSLDKLGGGGKNAAAPAKGSESGSGAQAPANGGGAGQSAGGKAPAGDAASVAQGAPAADAPNIGSIREIIMTGNVVISQEGRRATAGKAILYPQDGRVVLSDGPKVTDAQGTLSGWRMELYRDEKKVRILSDPSTRTRVTLPAIGDLGYREPEQPPAAATDGATVNQSGAASAAGSVATTADAAKAAGTNAVRAGTVPATPATRPAPSAGAASGTDTQPSADAKAEEAKKENSSPRGWNPVTSRRR